MAELQLSPAAPTCLESVNRVSKLPAVESSIHAAYNVYEKIKDYNSMTQWTCSTAENVVNKGVEVGKHIAYPIVQSLETPIKKVDIVLCSGLDYVETKVPAVKLPPGEMYTTTKDYVNNNVTPSVEAAYAYVEPTIKSAYETLEPTIEKAKILVEPAVEKALTIIDPLVQPVLEKVYELKDYGSQVVEEIIHNNHSHSEEESECEVCQNVASQARNTEEQQN